MIAGEDIVTRDGEVEGFTFGETKVDDFNLFIGSLAIKTQVPHRILGGRR